MNQKRQAKETVEQAEKQAAPAGEAPEQVRDPLAELLKPGSERLYSLHASPKGGGQGVQATGRASGEGL